MEGVAALCLRVLLESGSRHGIRSETLLEGNPSAKDLLAGRRGRYPWSDYIRLMERLADLLGGYEQMMLAGETLPDLAPEHATLFGAFVSPINLYRFIAHVVNPMVFPMVDTRVSVTEAGQINYEYEIQQGYEESLAYAWGSLGAARTVPFHIGLEPAKVDVLEMNGRLCRFLVTPPASKTMVARTKSALPRFARSVLHEIAGMRELDLAHSALRATVVELESQNSALASEVESRKQVEHALGRVLGAVANAAFLVGPDGLSGANELGRSALELDRRGLADSLRRAVGGERNLTHLEVTALPVPNTFLVISRGLEADLERRVSLAAQRWTLTPRHQDVLRGLVRGNSNAEIANELGCTPRTVESHITALLKRADAESRLSLVAAFWSDV